MQWAGLMCLVHACMFQLFDRFAIRHDDVDRRRGDTGYANDDDVDMRRGVMGHANSVPVVVY